MWLLSLKSSLSHILSLSMSLSLYAFLSLSISPSLSLFLYVKFSFILLTYLHNHTYISFLSSFTHLFCFLSHILYLVPFFILRLFCLSSSLTLALFSLSFSRGLSMSQVQHLTTVRARVGLGTMGKMSEKTLCTLVDPTLYVAIHTLYPDYEIVCVRERERERGWVLMCVCVCIRPAIVAV